MKELKEMNYFELLDLEAWCDNIVKKIGVKTSATYYVKLKIRAAAAREEITIHRCLEQFWAEKQSNNNQKENN